MKIFTSTQTYKLNRYTIEHEPVKSIDSMEHAAKATTYTITEEWSIHALTVVFVGPGNNGGDALAVARLLIDEGYRVSTYLFNITNHLSEDYVTNRQRLFDSKHTGGFTEITARFDPPELTADTLVIDGLFGSGLNKPLAGGFASLVKCIDQSPARIVDIDIPSDLMAEDNICNVRANIIHVTLTLTLHERKLSFLFANAQQFIGRLKVLDIRLSQEFIQKAEAQYCLLEEDDIRSCLLRRDDFSHKGDVDNAPIITGSYGMSRAAILTTRTCLRSGVGKVTVHTPKESYDVMQVSVPRAILQMDHEETTFTEAVGTDDFDILTIGPGLGRQEPTAIAMVAQIGCAQCPIVADADALDILANHRARMQQPPEGVIMTPHAKELDRLAGSPVNANYKRLHRARELVKSL